MTVKRYGGGSKTAQRLDQPVEFELELLRFDDPEVHTFHAVRKADTLLAARFMSVADDDPGAVLRLVTKLISKMLDNSDGVPVQWSPDVLPKPKNAGPKYEPKFRGPDGKLHPVADAGKFLEFAAGSSRRRWEALVIDEDATVELEALAEIARDLISATTDRPTDGS
jgi:hypothetical protein